MSGSLDTALAAFQAEMPIVAKSKTAKVPTKSGGSYSYSYADLADITQEAMPLLSKHGLSFVTLPRQTERGYELVGRLAYSSGEHIEGALPIAGNSPQEMGSSLTYMRRYLFGCLTGVVTDDDDDGQLAQAAKARKAPAKQSQKPAAEPSQDGALTQAQQRKMGALMREAGLTERGPAITYVNSLIGREVESRNQLSKAEAGTVIDALEADAQQPVDLSTAPETDDAADAGWPPVGEPPNA